MLGLSAYGTKSKKEKVCARVCKSTCPVSSPRLSLDRCLRLTVCPAMTSA